METTLRNATLADLASVLEEQRAAKRDVVVPASSITSENGVLRVPGMGGEAEITEDGVTLPDGLVRPTGVCDETISEKLGVPITYLRSVRSTSPSLRVPSTFRRRGPFPHQDEADEIALIDAILNTHFARFDKNVLVRAFVGDPSSLLPGEGVARAILSDRFGIVDNIDVLFTVLDAARQIDGIEVGKINLSERNMRVQLIAPNITALAPKLLAGYRPPRDVVTGFDGHPGLVSAGLEIRNSETGGGAMVIVPRFVVLICSNGMVQSRDAVKQVHLGGRLDEGLIRWSAETQAKNLDLIKAKTTDAVNTFLDRDYMESRLAEVDEASEAEVQKPEETIKVIAQRLRYNETERETLLSHFIQGGQVTAGGVFNAVTSLAQVVSDPDRAAEIEASALDALTIAAS